MPPGASSAVALSHCGQGLEIRTLVVSRSQETAARLKHLLQSWQPEVFHTEFLEAVGGTSLVSQLHHCDVVLVELPLPASRPLHTLIPLRELSSRPPVIVIDHAPTEDRGRRLLEQGAQDYLVAESLSAELLALSICCTIERHRLQKELESRAIHLRTLIDSNADGILVLRSDGRILLANPCAERMLGRSAEELKNWDFGLPLVEGEAVEIELRSADGSLGTAEMRVVEIEWESEPAFLASLRDITQRKAIERKLLRYQRRANMLAAELSQTEQRERKYLSQILHDHLQQVLVAARLHLDLCRRKLIDSDGEECLDRALRHIDESIAISRSLVAELSPAILYDGGLVAAVEWLCRSMKDRYGLEAAVQASPGFAVENEDLRAFLFQALRELLFNVVKHGECSPTTVRLEHQDDGGIRIAIQDRGPGFDPATLDLRDAGDRGFGLFSIQQRLEFWDGALRIDSRPGHGCQFEIMIPCLPSRTPPTDDR